MNFIAVAWTVVTLTTYLLMTTATGDGSGLGSGSGDFVVVDITVNGSYDGPYYVDEGDSNTTIEMCAQLNETLREDNITILASTVANTADSDDFDEFMNHLLTLSSMERKSCINITLIGDGVIEGNESFYVVLDLEGSMMSNVTIEVTIVDDDGACLSLEVSNNTLYESEMTESQVCVMLTNVMDELQRNVTVRADIIPLTTGNNNFYETFNDDFHMEPNQLPFEFLFPAGSNLSDSNNKQCFNISAVNDYCTEGNETLQVEIDTDNPLDVVVEIDGNSGGNWSSILAVSVINITIVDADNNDTGSGDDLISTVVICSAPPTSILSSTSATISASSTIVPTPTTTTMEISSNNSTLPISPPSPSTTVVISSISTLSSSPPSPSTTVVISSISTLSSSPPSPSTTMVISSISTLSSSPPSPSTTVVISSNSTLSSSPSTSVISSAVQSTVEVTSSATLSLSSSEALQMTPSLTSSTVLPTTSTTSEPAGGLSGGQIAGIIVAVIITVLLVIIILLLVFFLYRRRHHYSYRLDRRKHIFTYGRAYAAEPLSDYTIRNDQAGEGEVQSVQLVFTEKNRSASDNNSPDPTATDDEQSTENKMETKL